MGVTQSVVVLRDSQQSLRKKDDNEFFTDEEEKKIELPKITMRKNKSETNTVDEKGRLTKLKPKFLHAASATVFFDNDY